MTTALELAQLLTYSRTDAFKTCRRKAWFAYEAAIRSEVDAKALRMGSAGHDALEVLGNGESIDKAVESIHDRYRISPENVGQYEWEIERETVIRLVCGYDWRWQDQGLEYIHSEMTFEIPLRNPATGATTPIWKLAGKIDAIVQLADGRLAVKESKFLGDDISPDSFLWRRMRRDAQVSIYVIAARQLGFAVDCVLYDTVRKPTIRPTDIPILDEQKQKIVLDENRERVYNKNGAPRQTGDTEKGYVIQSRLMTANEYGEKLNNDIAERPEFYYQRVEIPRLDSDLTECEEELWQLQIAIREAQRTGRWFRTVNRNTCQFCSFDPICDRQDIDENSPAPEGFVKVTDLNPELKGSTE